jgi:hypothetical protein
LGSGISPAPEAMITEPWIGLYSLVFENGLQHVKIRLVNTAFTELLQKRLHVIGHSYYSAIRKAHSIGAVRERSTSG